MEFFQQVYEVVRGIPEGKVMTYGQVAKQIGTRDARRVGQALHANKNPDVPCHRVVFADGSLAPGYAFGGPEEQKKRLEKERVKFVGGKVDMVKSRHS
jgi:methylated-DNA-protein-cysteine methyltransferase-like protein